MRNGRMEPTAEASNRPQTSCSPLWKMEVNGRENDILLSETLQFAADHRKLHVAKNPQKKLQNRERVGTLICGRRGLHLVKCMR